MNQTSSQGETQGTEKNEFSGTFKDDLVKIPIQLRPKSDEELAKWKEKLSKGKEGGTHRYQVKNSFSVSGDLDQIAGTIEQRSNEALGSEYQVYKEDIKPLLREGASYISGHSFEFPKYKKESEKLWLEVSCTGDEDEHKEAFLKKEGAYFTIGESCYCEEKIRAFMRMLRVKEGTVGETGYTKLFGHGDFTKPPHNRDMSTHPKIVITAGSYSSSAAGAYQIVQDTYKGFQGYYQDAQRNWHYSEKIDYIKKYNIRSFDQESQDKLCLVIFKHNYLKKRANSFFYKNDGTPRPGRSKFNDAYGDIIQMIIDNNFDKALLTSSLCWASLPGAPYGQPTGTKEECKSNYEKFLKKEISGKSDLHLKKGFLKEFGYTCCEGNNESNGVCPDDSSQCFEYADVWENPRLNNQSNNVNKNRFHREKRYNNTYPKGYYHTGTDILSNGRFLNLHSLLCGVVVDVVNTFKSQQYAASSLGNTVTIKSKDKNGRDVWIKYCHLESVSVVVNDKVKHGQKIGVSGCTGNAGLKPNGNRGIKIEYWHVHIEASTDGVFYKGKNRVDPEQFMKTKFDETKQGNPINR
ncbi:MAG: peptidoglycan DD-metalloendopeptidase family protein [Flavobacteriales bacterium]